MFEWLFGKSFMAERDIPDLSGKVILVTGGMSLSNTLDSRVPINKAMR